METENKKELRCLKFEGYIYLPNEEDLNDKLKLRRYLSKLGMGRLRIFDENNNVKNEKMLSFGNLSEMGDYISREFSKRVLKRITTGKQK